MNKIIATFECDYTNMRREFDCTQKVLALTLSQLHELKDCDHTTDDLAPQDFIEEGKSLFDEQLGEFRNEFRSVEFGYSVKVVDSILKFFGVDCLSQIKF